MTIAVSILPIISVILVGFLSVKLSLVPKVQWQGVETLGFNVLIPAIIINSIYKSDLSLSLVGTYVWVLLLALGLSGLLALLFRTVLPSSILPNPKLTTLFQATTRWNAFIALAVGAQILGESALALISVAMAFIIPAINIVNIVVLSIAAEKRVGVSNILIGIAKNPLVVACAIGITINLSGFTIPSQISIPLDMISRGALAIGLLAIGASLNLGRLFSPSLVLFLGVGIRSLACPLIFLLFGSWVGLETNQLVSGILICGVPAASNGYVVAKKMGGDAELYADIVTWQTVIAPLTITLFFPLLS